MIVHPEVGKWLIAGGIKLFGMEPSGWRIASAVVGALMVLVMCRFVRRVTGSTVLGLVAGLLLSIDGLQLVLSRLALLDIFLAFFVLCGVHCVVADRQWLRDRLAAGGVPAVVASVAAPRRRQLRPGVRHEVVGGLHARRLRPARVAVERRRPPGLRPAAAAAALGLPRRRPGVRRAGRRRAGDVRRVVDGLADARRRLRAGPQQHPVHDVRRRHAVADRERARRRGPRRGHPVAAVAVVLPPGRLHLPQPLPQRLDPRLRLQAVDVAGDGSAGRRRRADRHPARLAGVRGADRLDLHPAGPAPRQPRRSGGAAAWR